MTTKRAADALDAPVDLAVPAGRYIHPLLLNLMGLGAMFLGAEFLGGAWALAAVGTTLVVVLRASRWLQTYLVRCGSSILVVKSKPWQPWMPSSEVADKYEFGTPIALGPSAFGSSPLNVGYHRYWIYDRDRTAVEQLVDSAGPGSTAR